uniref:Uncharacterized protein n=1 Tax=Paulinella chromatophora TaxID=39717 RepID=B1X5L3_PAUCH|nr:hypothetical protein PCC_0819 [Paulinella chromatophora]ACB43232.1 hypothetical protein PCC_0819 [Paulinella chromatophora]
MGIPIDKKVFLQRAYSRFGNKYDYTRVQYKSYKSPIKIRCVFHPVREIAITPEKHLETTGGCKYCLREIRFRSLERKLHHAMIESDDFYFTNKIIEKDFLSDLNLVIDLLSAKNDKSKQKVD